jgi:hypothetical protein
MAAIDLRFDQMQEEGIFLFFQLALHNIKGPMYACSSYMTRRSFHPQVKFADVLEAVLHDLLLFLKKRLAVRSRSCSSAVIISTQTD